MPQPLLMEDLQPGERISLQALTTHPGYLVLEKIFMAACKKATAAAIAVDPTLEGYEKKLIALQWKARERNEFCLEVLQSITYHADYAAQLEKAKEPSKPEGNPILKGMNND
jgi:hypothetical protein